MAYNKQQENMAHCDPKQSCRKKKKKKAGIFFVLFLLLQPNFKVMFTAGSVLRARKVLWKEKDWPLFHPQSFSWLVITKALFIVTKT